MLVPARSFQLTIPIGFLMALPARAETDESEAERAGNDDRLLYTGEVGITAQHDCEEAERQAYSYADKADIAHPAFAGMLAIKRACVSFVLPIAFHLDPF